MKPIDPHTWAAHVHHDLEQLRAAILDLIDCGPHTDDHDPVLRRPDKELQAAMRRGADRDADYARPPSTHTPGRITDTTGDHILRWETAVAAATADILTITDAAWHAITMVDVVHQHDVHDQHGNPLRPPLLPTIEDLDPPRPRPKVLDDPATCRRHTLTHLHWAAAVTDGLAATWERLDQHDRDRRQVAVHARRYAGQIARITRRHRHLPATTGPTRCLNPHGDLPHPVPPGQQICDGCHRPACGSPLDRDCRRRLSADDVKRGHQNCSACRMWLHRRRQKHDERVAEYDARGHGP